MKYIQDKKYQDLYDLGRETERTLNGYISYVWRLKQGLGEYGAHHIAEPADITYTIPDSPPE